MQTAPVSRWNRLIAVLTVFDAAVERATQGSVEPRLAYLEQRLTAREAQDRPITNQHREQT